MSTLVTSLSKEDIATIEGLFNEVVRLIRAGDWSGWASLFAEDAVFHPPNQPAVRGRAELQKWGNAFPPMDAFGLSNVQAAGEGNFGYGTSTYTLTIKGVPPDTGKQLVVFRRETSGWKVVACSFNSDLPMPSQTHPGQ